MTENESTMSSQLATIWLRQRPLLEQRLDLLDHAVSAATSGTLLKQLREEAAGTAHKLAGCLGMYGYDHGTLVARKLEVLLDYPVPDPIQLRILTLELRASVFPSQPPSGN